MKAIRALIVDDEPLAREGLRELLKKAGDITIIGECDDGVHAVEQTLATKPDLIFLDVQMPEMDGFEVLREVNQSYNPAIIFVTAYDEFAIKAFDVHALDYLLKPVDPDRLHSALEHVRKLLANKDLSHVSGQILSLLDDVRTQRKQRDRIVIRSEGVISFVKTKEIEWIQAEGDYVSIHERGKKHVIRGKIGEFQEKLTSDQFIRIHRSTIVNIDHVKEIEPLFYGEYSVLLHSGMKLRLSRSYRRKLQSFLDRYL